MEPGYDFRRGKNETWNDLVPACKPMKITEIAFIVYAVSDIKRSRAFYETTLGLDVSEVVDYSKEGGISGQYWIEYNIGENTFAITNSFPPSQQSGLAFEVENYNEAVESLKKVGTPFATERIDSPVCCFAVITDPDSNQIIIHKRKPQKS